MAEITYAYFHSATNRNSTSSTYEQIGILAGDGIAGGDLVANTKYLAISKMGVGGNSSAGNDFEFHLITEGTELTYSHARHEPRRTGAVAKHPYFWMGEFTTDGTPDNYIAEFKSAGTNTVATSFTSHLLLGVDDLAAADYKYDEDLTSLASLDNTGWTDGASITIGDGSSDYAIFFFAHSLMQTVGTAIRLRVDVNGTAYDYIELECEDTAEEFCTGGQLYIPNPGTGVTAKIQVQTNSATAGQVDVDCNRIAAIRLNAFEDHFGERDATDVPVTVVDTDTTVGATTHTTSTAATRDWLINGYNLIDVGESTKQHHRRIADSTLGDIIGDTNDLIIQNGDGDQVPTSLNGMANLANATSLSLSFIVQEEADVTPNPSHIDTHLFGFTLELAAAAPALQRSGQLGLSGVGR